MKLYYFDLYGRAEATRMALHKAGVQYEDIRLTGEKWIEFKNSGKLEFGQMPALELDDGKMLTQSMAILDYVCQTYKLQPTDPYTNWLGSSFCAYA